MVVEHIKYEYSPGRFAFGHIFVDVDEDGKPQPIPDKVLVNWDTRRRGLPNVVSRAKLRLQPHIAGVSR